MESALVALVLLGAAGLAFAVLGLVCDLIDREV
jgi:hypothetical protein